jgi:TRAP-type C4-dicarboxylate transport system substrate-binding protein
MNRAMHEFIERHPEDFPDVKILNVFVHQGQVLHSKRPIRRADDFRGLKVRVPSRIGGWMVEALGGTPLGSPVQNVPEMLSKGIVDAAFIPYEASYGLKVHELVDHHITLGGPGPERIQTQIFVLAMNPAVYARLDPDLRAVIDAHSGPGMSDWFGQLWIDFERPGEAAARASGELFALPPDEVRIIRERVEQAVIDRWVAAVARRGIDGRALIAEAHALLRKHAAVEARADDINPVEPAP